jgi:hypothetical protein
MQARLREALGREETLLRQKDDLIGGELRLGRRDRNQGTRFTALFRS